MHLASDQDGLEIEATIETVLHFGQIAVGILGEIEMMVSPRNSGPQIGEHGIDAAEFRMRRPNVKYIVLHATPYIHGNRVCVHHSLHT